MNMSANIDALVYIGETPWHNMGVKLDKRPTSATEIIDVAKLDWKVNYTEMYTVLHPSVFNYKAIYREDTSDVLGVVNQIRPNLVQNIDTFRPVDDLLEKEVAFETVGDLGKGEKVWGCFKISSEYKVLDDDIETYLVVVNDHLKADGKITVFNTPVRVVCQNTLERALSDAFYKVRVPVVNASGSMMEVALRVFNTANESIGQLSRAADEMVGKKVDKSYVDAVLDKLFPYPDAAEESGRSQIAQERVSMIRNQFVTSCMGADNLANYRGTQWQLFNACTDFDTHYFKNVDKAFDPNYRMKLLAGLQVDNTTSLTAKFMKIRDRIAA